MIYKGPLVAIIPDSESIFDPACLASINIYKNHVKKYLLSLQSLGEDDEWPVLLLNNIAGLRKSSRIKSIAS